MRQLAMALILLLPMGAEADAQSAGNAGAAVMDRMMQDKCRKPDSELIKPGTTDQYNAQAKGFNDCLRIYVESENNKISQIRAEAGGQIDSIKDRAFDQIHDIERAINTAIIEVSIVNGGAQDGDLPPPATALSAFPAAACNRPDAALLKPVKGKPAASIQNQDRFEDQRLAFEACMRTYIAQAKNEILQVKANAELALKQITGHANPRIAQINDDVTKALNDARAASGERDAKVTAIHSPFRSDGISPAAYQPGGTLSGPFQPPQIQSPGTENVIVNGERLPRSADMPSGAGDPDAISCRAPQPLTDSRLMGPEICKHNRDWAKLYKDGWNISADGSKLVPAEKWLTLHPQNCVSQQVPGSTSLLATYCDQGDRN
jgi:hypothetical protein